MTYLKKEEIFFDRDGEGNVIPIEVTLTTLPDKPMIKVTPLTKGELADIMSKSKDSETNVETDIDVIINHCKEPSFTEDDRVGLMSAAKIVYTNAIALAIFSISSGISQKQLVDEGKKAVIEKELQNFQTQ
ncbi:hypothetical protein KAI04_03820 [Candidatus Pacearchaeota archaeon]|nr:hypothetical protein [Candidatus Pacearchaeota archaeon]